jgi:hypothetical protein
LAVLLCQVDSIMVSETVENVLKIDCFAWDVKPGGNDGD